MSKTTLNSFAKSTGKTAAKKSGGFKGTLLGKAAEGLEALEAIGQLAIGHANRFMELALEAAKVAKQTLEAGMTIPFASQELEFNAALNPAARAPSLGLGAGGSRRTQARPPEEEKGG